MIKSPARARKDSLSSSVSASTPAAKRRTAVEQQEWGPTSLESVPRKDMEQEVLHLLCVLGFAAHLNTWFELNAESADALNQIWQANRADWMLLSSPTSHFSRALRFLRAGEFKAEERRSLYTILSMMSQALVTAVSAAPQNPACRLFDSYFHLFCIFLEPYHPSPSPEWTELSQPLISVFISTISVCLNQHKKLFGTIFPVYDLLHTREVIARMNDTLMRGRPPIKGLMFSRKKRGETAPPVPHEGFEALGWYSTITKSLAQHMVEEMSKVEETDVRALLDAIATLSTQHDIMIKTHAHNALLTLLRQLDTDVAERFLCVDADAAFIQSFCYNLSVTTSVLATRRAGCTQCANYEALGQRTCCAECEKLINVTLDDLTDYATFLRDVLSLFDEGIRIKCLAQILAVIILPVWVRGCARDVRIVFRSKHIDVSKDGTTAAVETKIVDPVTSRLLIDTFLEPLDSEYPELNVLIAYLITSPNAPVCVLTHVFGLPFIGLSITGLSSCHARSAVRSHEACCCCRIGQDPIPMKWLKAHVKHGRLGQLISILELYSLKAMRAYLNETTDVSVDLTTHHPALGHVRHIVANPIRTAKLSSWTEGLSAQPREYTIESVTHALLLPADIIRCLRILERHMTPAFLGVMKLRPPHGITSTPCMTSELTDSTPRSYADPQMGIRMFVRLQCASNNDVDSQVHVNFGWHAHTIQIHERIDEKSVIISYPREDVDESEWLWNLLTSMFNYDQLPRNLLHLCFGIIHYIKLKECAPRPGLERSISSVTLEDEIDKRLVQVARNALDDLWHLCGLCGRQCTCEGVIKLSKLWNQSCRPRPSFDLLALGVELILIARQAVLRARRPNPELLEWLAVEAGRSNHAFLRKMLFQTKSSAKAIGTSTWPSAVEACTTIGVWLHTLVAGFEGAALDAFLAATSPRQDRTNEDLPNCSASPVDLFKCANNTWLAILGYEVFVGVVSNVELDNLRIAYNFTLAETYVRLNGPQTIEFNSSRNSKCCQVELCDPEDMPICEAQLLKRQFTALSEAIASYKNCF